MDFYDAPGFNPSENFPTYGIAEYKKNVQFSNGVTIYEVGISADDRSAQDGMQELRDRERFKMRIYRKQHHIR